MKRLLLSLVFVALALPADAQWIVGPPAADVSGLVSVTGTPVDNQVAIWTAADTLEGDANLWFDGTSLRIGGVGGTLLSSAGGGFTMTGLGGEAEDLVFNLTDIANGVDVTSSSGLLFIDWNSISLAFTDGGNGNPALHNAAAGTQGLRFDTAGNVIYDGGSGAQIVLGAGGSLGIRLGSGVPMSFANGADPVAAGASWEFRQSTAGILRMLANSNEEMTIDLITGDDIVAFGTPTGITRADWAFTLNPPSVSASESFKQGLGVASGADAAHDVDVAAGVAQSFDVTHNIVFAAQAEKRLDEQWVTGAAGGMLGLPDVLGANDVDFGDGTGVVTSDGGTPFANCNVGDTFIVTGSTSNNGNSQVVTCTSDLTITTNATYTLEAGSSTEDLTFVPIDSWLHLFLIELAGVEDVCADTSQVAANCLARSGYDQWRLLQSIFTDSAANIVAP